MKIIFSFRKIWKNKIEAILIKNIKMKNKKSFKTLYKKYLDEEKT